MTGFFRELRRNYSISWIGADRGRVNTDGLYHSLYLERIESA